MRLKPTFDVDVALPFTLRPDRVVVPKPIDDTESCVAVDEPTTNPYESPAIGLIDRRPSGVVEEIPTEPKLLIRKLVALLEPTTNCAKALLALGLTENVANGVVVLIPTEPANVDVAVVVASMLPTVSCVPVAIRVPAEFDVMIEFGENVVAVVIQVVQSNVPPAPPMNEPRVPEYVIGDVTVGVDVATVLTAWEEPTYATP